MDVLDSHVNPADSIFKTNRDRMYQLVAELRDRLTRVRQGGGPKYIQRHREQGKLPVRERIDRSRLILSRIVAARGHRHVRR